MSLGEIIVSGKLARVDWQLGQTLVPEHFIAQEESLLTDMVLRLGLTGKPFYGIIQLKFDESNLLNDAIRVEEFSGILETGELIKKDANAEFSDHGDSILFPKDITRVELFIEIRSAFIKGHDIIESRNHDEGEHHCHAVSKKHYQLKVICVPTSVPAEECKDKTNRYVEMVKIADFVMGADNNWSLSERFVPPCLLLDRLPYFKRRRHTIEVYLDDFILELNGMFLLNTEQQKSNIKESALLSQLYRCQYLLDYIHHKVSEITVHPFDLFIELKQLYIDISLYRNKLPDKVAIYYQHKNLAVSFDDLIGLLRQVIYSEEFDYDAVVLREKDGIYFGEIDNIEANMDFYLAVHHENKSELEVFSPPAKASSRERVPLLHTLSLQGVTFTEVTNHAIRSRLAQLMNVDEPMRYYQINKQDEWENVVDERSFGFYGQNNYRSFRFYLVSEIKQYAINA